MRTTNLIRYSTGDEGTFGSLILDDGWSCVTGELPWKNNQSNISCIPVGTYLVQWLYSPKHNGYCYHLIDVPNRGSIEIHSGNFCGDVEKGYKSDVLGCILPGQVIEDIGGQTGVTNSVKTLSELEKNLGIEDWTLTIEEHYAKN